MKKLLTLFAVIIFINTNAQTCLSRVDSLTINYNPTSFCTADFNGDGKTDIATANGWDNSVSISLGVSAGHFGSVTNFTLSTSPNAIISADFNADGKADLATSNNQSTSSVSVLLGDGTGGFSVTSFTTSFPPSTIASADFNGDGKLDIVTSSPMYNNFTILIGDGAGNLTLGSTFVASNWPGSITSVDFNGDGKADIATANANASNASVFLGNGSGGFGVATNFNTGPAPSSIINADFNGDGKMDLATANNNSNNVSVLLGNGAGSFGMATNFTAASNPMQVISTDFNNDGKLDLATLSGSSTISLLMGNGAGGFTNSASFLMSWGKKTITSADFNNDGKSDIALLDSMYSKVFILLNSITHTISINATTSNICSGNNAILTASGSTQYVWSTSATTNTIAVTPTTTTTYSVSDGTNCTDTASITINVGTTTSPNICMVTTDAASGYNYNIVYWDKTSYTNVDSFIVYRQSSLNYLRIGSVSKNALSEFTDTAFSIGGPNGGNPLYSSWFYKLAIKDTCGNISAMSPYHQTMFLQENNANFSWNAYTVETGQANPLTGYSFLRDDNNTGAWHVLANIAGTSSTDPNYNSYPNGNWRITAAGFNCTPTLRLAGGNNNTQSTYVVASSNPIKPVATGISQFSNNTQINIYPNPAQNNFTIQTSGNQKQVVNVFDLTGKQVLTQTINGTTTIDGSKLSEGVYNISILNNAGVINKKLVIVK